MQPLSNWPLAARQGLVGVFTDIDDTLTTHGAITPDALQALADLRAAGLQVIPITGRHVGWCLPFLQGSGTQAPLPVHAMVAENGAVAWVPEGDGFGKRHQQDAATREANAARMEAAAQTVMAAVPGLQRSADLGGRDTDISFDYNEFVHLAPEAVAQTVALLQQAGMHTSVSSIHIHGCYGDFNKWQGACWIVQELLGRSLEAEIDRWVFVGDSGNDMPMFRHFTHSVGGANIRKVADQLPHLPPYITPSERGAGFAEVAAAILAARRA
ncbi:MAG: HAD-IIB family hydrolase [Rhodoferax sp.]|nr:HAD-IIB family hydrolase [Rhodoferax sp.]